MSARTLQVFGYSYASMATLWTYDYVCSLHEEWTYLLRSRWTKVKALYIIARCVPLLITTVHLYLVATPNENADKCQILFYVITSSSLISLTCSECFFVLRTYALWNNNRILLKAMLSTLLVVVVLSFITTFTPIVTSYSSASLIPSCHQNLGSFSFFMPFTLFFVFQLGLVFLTLIRTIQNWRSDVGPLYTLLVKHNIFYYACGLLLSAVNILIPVVLLSDSGSYFLPEGYGPPIPLRFPTDNDPKTHTYSFEVVILVILATRMHLHLWHMDQHVNGSDFVVWISMSDRSPADRRV
ncbi:hypothetical protein BD769DRAFT_95826 [Suillus cothurnatus]|nr:hypothetical protein BD769DRAFT_95826 [Suillus cothurnatus]